ncbi:MAG TPA: nitroreductase family protein, partial [Armatimonadota bacterium]
MHVMDAVMARRSVRKFMPEGLEKSVIEKLIDAAVHAPNAANSQNWAFGVIQDAGRLREYSSRIKEDLLAHVDRFEWLARYKEMLADPEYHIFYNAPALVIIFSKPGGIMAKENCCLAAENLMLAAC